MVTAPDNGPGARLVRFRGHHFLMGFLSVCVLIYYLFEWRVMILKARRDEIMGQFAEALPLAQKRYQHLQSLLDLYYRELGWEKYGNDQYVYVGKAKLPEANLVNLDGMPNTPEIEKAMIVKEMLEKIMGTYIEPPGPITLENLGKAPVVEKGAAQGFEKITALIKIDGKVGEFLKAASVMENVRKSPVLVQFKSDLETTATDMDTRWHSLILSANKYNFLVEHSLVAKYYDMTPIDVGPYVLLGIMSGIQAD